MDLLFHFEAFVRQNIHPPLSLMAQIHFCPQFVHHQARHSKESLTLEAKGCPFFSVGPFFLSCPFLEFSLPFGLYTWPITITPVLLGMQGACGGGGAAGHCLNGGPTKGHGPSGPPANASLALVGVAEPKLPKDEARCLRRPAIFGTGKKGEEHWHSRRNFLRKCVQLAFILPLEDKGRRYSVKREGGRGGGRGGHEKCGSLGERKVRQTDGRRKMKVRSLPSLSSPLIFSDEVQGGANFLCFWSSLTWGLRERS